MQERESGAVRAVAWSEIWPWLSLVRCFRMAIAFRLLLLSGVAIVLTIAGWSVFAIPFPGIAKDIEPYRDCPWRVVTELVPNTPPLFDKAGSPLGANVSRTGQELFWEPWQNLTRPMRDLSRPVREIFIANVSWDWLAYWLLCAIWALGIWAFFGGAITRVVAVRFASEEHLGWGPMFRHALVKWRAYFAAPLFPLLAVLLIALPIALASWVLLGWDDGVLVAGIVWPMFLVGGLLMTVLLLGLVFGWPLMWSTISAEGTDSFDALSRSYAYVFQRPLHYLFYAVVAVLLGVLGWVLVWNFSAAIIGLTYGAASWSCDPDRMLAIASPSSPGAAHLGPVGVAGGMVIRFWVGCVKVLAVGFLYSYFWTASTVIYFLLRRHVDATEMDEVFLDEPEDQPTYGLPPIKTDEAGAPVVEEGDEDS